ncbi:MAG: hypothetical protein JNM84_11625 [Planctomycetes bacterium]|nr:hypothetical protein [Planctomycetota bacterium]
MRELRFLVLASALLLIACDQQEPHDHPHPHPHPTGAAPVEAGAAPEAPELRLPLGQLAIGATKLEVVQIERVVPGSYFEVFAQPIEGPKPVATRIWLGDESGVGSRKGLVHEEVDGPHAHVDIRADFDASKHRIWIELERADGQRELGSIAPSL